MKVVVITGTSKGLGKSIYTSLMHEGYKIAAISRSAQPYDFGKVLRFQGDLTNKETIEAFIYRTIKKYGHIDYLINNAGIVNLRSFLEYEEWEYEEIFKINVASSFYMSQECIKQMLKQPTGGHIINIGSTRSITGAPNKSLYSMSKFALRGMTQCINAEFKDKKITSTIICPGQLEKIEAEVVKIIKDMIKNNERNIPEIIVGGQL